MKTAIWALFAEEHGADLIEYALLSAFIGVCAVASWMTVPQLIAAAYNAWDTNVQNISACTPDPGGGGCP
jgi:Flp pilus assembly pilin Flp